MSRLTNAELPMGSLDSGVPIGHSERVTSSRATTALRRTLGIVWFLLLAAVGVYVVLMGLVAPWAGAPQGVTSTLVFGGLVLLVAGIAAAVETVRGASIAWWTIVYLSAAALVATVATLFFSVG